MNFQISLLEFIVVEIIELIQDGIFDYFIVFSEIFPLIEENKIGNHYFRFMKFGPVFFIDYAGFESPFDINKLSLDEELLRSLGEGSPRNTVGVLRLALIYPRRITIVSVGGNGKKGDFFVSNSGFNIWILGNISDKDDFIDGSHSMLE